MKYSDNILSISVERLPRLAYKKMILNVRKIIKFHLAAVYIFFDENYLFGKYFWNCKTKIRAELAILKG